jgi:hypothetical protein
MARAFEHGVLLAHTYEKEKPVPNPKGWWVSEKLDGVRAYWNGENFYTRSGTLIHAPKFFKQGLPSAGNHLDGELWLGRGQFEACAGIVRTTTGAAVKSEQWRKLRYLIFDAPIVGGKADLPFEERHAFGEQVASSAPFAVAVGVRKCLGKAHMQQLLKAVVGNGGEGLMLRKPSSSYERTRSHALLKVKTFFDAEAKVVGHSKDATTGCLLGALECEMPGSGARFKIGTGFSKADRVWTTAKKQWPVGTVVTYKYQNLTEANSVPRFSTYLRIRSDKSWAEVVADALQQDQQDVLDHDDDGAMLSGQALERMPSLMMSNPVDDNPAEERETELSSPANGSSGGGGGGGGSTDTATGAKEKGSGEVEDEGELERTASAGILFTDGAVVHGGGVDESSSSPFTSTSSNTSFSSSSSTNVNKMKRAAAAAAAADTEDGDEAATGAVPSPKEASAAKKRK